MIRRPTSQLESMKDDDIRDHGSMCLPEDFDRYEAERKASTQNKTEPK